MKKCNHYGEFKHEEEFSFRYKKLGIRQKACKKCMAKFNQKYYRGRAEDQKQTVKQQKAARTRISQAFILDYLRSHPCVDCGERDIRVLEFDHVKGIKKRNISQMVSNGYKVETIKKSLLKKGMGKSGKIG